MKNSTLGAILKNTELPYVQCEHNCSSEQLPRLERQENREVPYVGLLLNSYDKSDIVTLT